MKPRRRLPGPVAVAVVGGGMLTVVVLGLLGVVLVPKMVGHYSWTLERLFRPAPKQPVAFSHQTHVQKAGIDCLFCHRLADKGRAATVPALEQCMFCHAIITGEGSDRGPWVAQEIAKVRTAYEQGQPIRWNRVHRLPDHVKFVHEAHIRAGFTCSTCHGDVGSMAQVRQVRSLRMGDCVGCHRQYGGPTDCAACHY